MDHVRTSPYYPQSSGKIERWHASLKTEAVRPKTPLSLDGARRVVGAFVEEYRDRNSTGPRITRHCRERARAATPGSFRV
jgi:transposase InsO family protein